MPPENLLVYATVVASAVLAAVEGLRRAKRARRRRRKRKGQYQDLIR